MRKGEKEIRQKLKSDFLHYAEKCLKIRTKAGAILPFALNAAQKKIHAALEDQLQRKGKVRALILKGRQQGCSTYVQARLYWKVTHRRGVRAFILTHLESATQNIYQITRRFHDYCPAPVRPHASHANKKQIVFDKLDSDYHVGTAKSKALGRSNTLQYFHGSEVAYWTNAEEHVSGILQAVPDEAGTEVILESTSAGASGLFHRMCVAAAEGRSEYELVFVPWFLQTEYRKAPPRDFSFSAEEEGYAARYGLDAAQICWRRSKIAEIGGELTFRREYPATLEEAFHADHPGALWTREAIQKNRRHAGDLPEMARIVVAIDPAVTATGDETGIIVAGLGTDGHGYVLEDLSGNYTPHQWASLAVTAYERHSADRVVAEVNQGGEMVEHTLRTIAPKLPYKAVRASRGKVVRAEPVAALDAQGKIHHVGIFPALEDQMCCFGGQAAQSPDRVDARIWAMTELLLSGRSGGGPVIWSS